MPYKDKLFTDGERLSPIVAVILMVFLTVLLAAIIATFVLGLGSQITDIGPNAEFRFDVQENASSTTTGDSWRTQLDPNVTKQSDVVLLTITHVKGATIPSDQIGIKGSTMTTHLTDATYSDLSTSTTLYSDSQIGAGDTVSVWVQRGDVIHVTWENAAGSKSTILTTYTISE